MCQRYIVVCERLQDGNKHGIYFNATSRQRSDRASFPENRLDNDNRSSVSGVGTETEIRESISTSSPLIHHSPCIRKWNPRCWSSIYSFRPSLDYGKSCFCLGSPLRSHWILSSWCGQRLNRHLVQKNHNWKTKMKPKTWNKILQRRRLKYSTLDEKSHFLLSCQYA